MKNVKMIRDYEIFGKELMNSNIMAKYFYYWTEILCERFLRGWHIVLTFIDPDCKNEVVKDDEGEDQCVDVQACTNIDYRDRFVRISFNASYDYSHLKTSKDQFYEAGIVAFHEIMEIMTFSMYGGVFEKDGKSGKKFTHISSLDEHVHHSLINNFETTMFPYIFDDVWEEISATVVVNPDVEKFIREKIDCTRTK